MYVVFNATSFFAVAQRYSSGDAAASVSTGGAGGGGALIKIK
jgi:hypothetical protein